MTTDEYVPSDEDMREDHVQDRANPDAGRRQWDRWLAAHDARIRCDAYDEGYEDGQHDAHEHRPWRKSVHPYRQEQTNE